MKSLPECEEYTTNSPIVLKERRSKITFLNADRNKILIIKVDDCVIKGHEVLRCDYAVVPFHKVEIEIYVELKGHKISHAVEQIKSTIRLLSENPQQIRKLCFIVSTRNPELTTTIQQFKRQFKRDFNAILRIKNTPDSYNLKDLSSVTT